MVIVRQGSALGMSLTSGGGAERPAVAPGLYDRPALVIDPGMHTARLWRAAADSDGHWVVTGSDDKTVRVWSLADGALSRVIRLPAGPGDVGKPRAVAISPDGALIAVGGWTRFTNADPQEQIYLFERASGALVKRIDGLPNVVWHLTYSRDGRCLAATLHAGGIRLYNRDRGWAEVARDDNYGDQSHGAAFAADGRLATTACDGKVRLYGADLNGAVRPSIAIDAPGGQRPYGIAFRPDGTCLAVGYDDSTAVTLLDGGSLASLALPEVGAINGDLSKVAWSLDGRTLFAAGKYRANGVSAVLAWRDAGAGARSTLLAASYNVMSLVPQPDGDLLVAAADPRLDRLRPDGTAVWVHGPANADFVGQFDKLSVSNDGTRVGFGFAAFGKLPARFDLTKARGKETGQRRLCGLCWHASARWLPELWPQWRVSVHHGSPHRNGVRPSRYAVA